MPHAWELLQVDIASLALFKEVSHQQSYSIQSQSMRLTGLGTCCGMSVLGGPAIHEVSMLACCYKVYHKVQHAIPHTLDLS